MMPLPAPRKAAALCALLWVTLRSRTLCTLRICLLIKFCGNFVNSFL